MRTSCEDCKQPPDLRGLQEHHDPPKRMGGSKNWKGRIWRLCGKCHSKRHGIEEKEGEPRWTR